jgi:NAD(P)-dependent dehydrogenase (short-subunit alcohol dehydrogenase family)
MTTVAARVVLITGANGGLGRAAALRLAERGFRVWAAMRDPAQGESLDEEARRRGRTIERVRLDVTDPDSVERAVATVLERSGSLYGVVNNAGITRRGYFEDLTDTEIREILEVNLLGPMNVTRAALPHLRAARRGRVVMVTSIGGRIGMMAVTAYIASKFGLEGFSESLSLELGPLGIQVSIIEPGIVQTGIWDEERRVAERARDPRSPYYRYFQRIEAQAEAMLRTSTITPEHVADAVVRALTARRPRLRYVVGRRAKLTLLLRRYLPGELFERLFFGEIVRRVSRGVELGPG